MRGKLARAFRKITGFIPQASREYIQLDNGMIFESIEDEDKINTIVTKRRVYRMAKKKYSKGDL